MSRVIWKQSTLGALSPWIVNWGSVAYKADCVLRRNSLLKNPCGLATERVLEQIGLQFNSLERPTFFHDHHSNITFKALRISPQVYEEDAKITIIPECHHCECQMTIISSVLCYSVWPFFRKIENLH